MILDKRNSNLELLRIVSTLSIIALHIFRHSGGGVLFDSGWSVNHAFAIILSSWGLVGVFAFMMISSFFLLESKQVKMEKVIKLIVMTSLYTVITYCFASAFKGETIEIKQLIKSTLAPFLNSYWYITSYLLLYIFHPILNLMIEQLDVLKLGILVTLSSLIVFAYKFVYIDAPVGTFGIFLAIYFIVAFYKRYGKTYEISKKLRYLAVISFVVVMLMQIIYVCSEEKSSWLKYFVSQTTSKVSPFMVVIALALFDYFMEKENFHSRLINSCSKSCLAVYVLHESDYISSVLWDEIFRVSFYYDKHFWILIYIGIILMVYFVCTMIDLLLEPVYGSFCKRLSEIIYRSGSNVQMKGKKNY